MPRDTWGHFFNGQLVSGMASVAKSSILEVTGMDTTSLFPKECLPENHCTYDFQCPGGACNKQSESCVCPDDDTSSDATAGTGTCIKGTPCVSDISCGDGKCDLTRNLCYCLALPSPPDYHGTGTNPSAEQPSGGEGTGGYTADAEPESFAGDQSEFSMAPAFYKGLSLTMRDRGRLGPIGELLGVGDTFQVETRWRIDQDPMAFHGLGYFRSSVEDKEVTVTADGKVYGGLTSESIDLGHDITMKAPALTSLRDQVYISGPEDAIGIGMEMLGLGEKQKMKTLAVTSAIEEGMELRDRTGTADPMATNKFWIYAPEELSEEAANTPPEAEEEAEEEATDVDDTSPADLALLRMRLAAVERMVDNTLMPQ